MRCRSRREISSPSSRRSRMPGRSTQSWNCSNRCEGVWRRAMGIAKIGTAPQDMNASAGMTTLREATQQFESLFISQLMKSMRDTVPQSHLMGSGSGQQLFREMLDQELAGRVAESGGIGIGEMLYRQLSPNRSDGRKNGTGEKQSAFASRNGLQTPLQTTTALSRSQNHED